MAPFQICVRWSRLPSKMAAKLKIEKRGMKLKKNLLWNYWANLNQTFLKWSLGGPLSKLCPSAPPLLKIEISSNGQNCSIFSQKVPKFELYKHNDELFNIYYGIFLWTLNFCRFWPIMQIRKKGGWNLKKIFSSETVEPISTKLCWNDSWVVLFQNCVRHFRIQTKMATTAELNLT